jgi:predicted signal transduction protein with EAL and GGDEF domain
MNRIIEMIFCLLVLIGIASVVPALLFGIFAVFFVATGGFPTWIWLIPTILSIAWYIQFFMGID